MTDPELELPRKPVPASWLRNWENECLLFETTVKPENDLRSYSPCNLMIFCFMSKRDLWILVEVTGLLSQRLIHNTVVSMILGCIDFFCSPNPIGVIHLSAQALLPTHGVCLPAKELSAWEHQFFKIRGHQENMLKCCPEGRNYHTV